MKHLRARSPGLFTNPVGAADFRSVAEFAGALFVCSRSSLMRFAIDGTLQQTWHAGASLPPYPLMKLAVRDGIGSPELWIATDGGGVVIYDGKAFRELLPNKEAQRQVSAMLALSDGRMVIGTREAGVLITDGKRLEVLHSQFAATKVSALAGNQEALWIGTRDSGVWLWRAGEAKQFLHELPDVQVLTIATSGTNTWIGTPFGVGEFRNDSFVRPLAQGVFAQSLVEDNGVLQVGTIDEGVLQLSLTTRTMPVKFYGSSRVSGNIVEFAKVGHPTLAVCSRAVTRLGDNQPLITSESSISDSHVSALHVDNAGRLWIGYFDRGLDIVDQSMETRPFHFEDDLVFCVNRIREDPSTHNVAVATANGLAIFDSGARLREIFNRKHGLIADHVTDVLFEPSQTPGEFSLAAATPAGITFLDGGSLASISAFQGLVNNHVYTLAGDRSRLFAGTLGGFSLLSSGTVRSSSSTANSNLRQNWITASVAENGAFYAGTYGSGVIRIERDGSITSFREFANSRIEINPNALDIVNGSVYAGTAGQGLAVLPRGEIRWRFLRDGLPSLNITALAARDARLYIGTDNGLVRASERELVR
jgi:ligand-binding sensor domain-containing protein